MSIIDKLLVLLDDGKSRTIEQISRTYKDYTKQVLSASLGRIVSKKLVKKSSLKYTITEKGQRVITDYLSSIDKFKIKKNNTCLFVIFNIPESQRINRDIMRNFLVDNGYARLHNTVWVDLYSHAEKLNKTIKDLGIESRVLCFEGILSDKDMINIHRNLKYKFETINKEYKNFIKNTENFIKQKNKNPITAQLLVFEFAKNTQKDPIIPLENNNKKYLGHKAFEQYKKLRKYC